MSAEWVLFAVLSTLALGGGLLLSAEGRRPVALGAAYLGIGLALSGILLLGGGTFAALFLFVLTLSTALGFILFGIRLQGRSEEAFDLPPPTRLLGKFFGSLAAIGSVVLLAVVLPTAGTVGEAPVAVTSVPASLGLFLFGRVGLVMLALGLLFLVATTASLVLIFGRSSE